MEKNFETIELDGVEIETVVFDQAKADENMTEFDFAESEASSNGIGE